MRKSLLGYAIVEMMQQDEWADEYNPGQRFNVNQYDYDTLEDYLSALQEEWKYEVDPDNEFDDYVDVSDYIDFDSYELAIEEYQNKKTWKDKYDSEDEFDVNPYEFDNENDYVYALKEQWKETYDFLDEFSHIEPFIYDCVEDYKEDIEQAKEQKSWQEEFDPYDEYGVDPFLYFDKSDYLEELNKWINKKIELEAEEYDEFEIDDFNRKAKEKIDNIYYLLEQLQPANKKLSLTDIYMNDLQDYLFYVANLDGHLNDKELFLINYYLERDFTFEDVHLLELSQGLPRYQFYKSPPKVLTIFTEFINEETGKKDGIAAKGLIGNFRYIGLSLLPASDLKDDILIDKIDAYINVLNEYVDDVINGEN